MFSLNLKLGTKMLLLLIIPILSISVITTVYNYYQARTALNTEVMRTAELIVQNFNAEFAVLLSGKEAAVNVMSVIVSEKYLSSDQLVSCLKNIQDSNKDFANVFVGFEDKRYYESSGWVPTPDYDPRKRHWYQKAMATDGVCYSDIYEDRASKHNVISVTKKIIIDGKPIGVIGIDLNLAEIQAMVAKIKMGETGYAFVLDSKGNYIYHPVWTMTDNIKTNIYKLAPVFLSGNIEQRIIQYYGVEKFYMSSPIEKTGWVLVVTAPTSELLASVIALRDFFIIIALISMLGLGVVIIFVTQYITKPIRKLAAVARKVANGDLSVDVNYLKENTSSDEIGTLMRSFYDMFNQLKGLIRKKTDDLQQEIDERKKMEMEIVRLDRLNLVGEMAATIGHEIRNPITTVRGYLQFFMKKKDLSNCQDSIELMIDELDRANDIITEYLSLAKNKMIDIEEKNINEVINALLPLIEADALLKNKSIYVELDNVPNVCIDEKEIRQMILNFVRNGLESMPEGGQLVLRTYVEGNEVVMAVQDQGSGIPLEVLNHLGTPFFTTKANGTGLGLAVCYSIAVRHKATIDIDTGPEGTTFYANFKQAERKV